MIAQTCDHSIGISYTSRTNTLHRLTPPMQARVLSRVYGLDRPSPKMFRTRNLYLKLFVTIKSDHFERRINETFIIRLQTPKNKIPATRARVVRQSFSAMWVGIDKILRVPSPFRKKNNKNTKSSQRADGRRDGTRYFFFFLQRARARTAGCHLPHFWPVGAWPTEPRRSCLCRCAGRWCRTRWCPVCTPWGRPAGVRVRRVAVTPPGCGVRRWPRPPRLRKYAAAPWTRR